MREEQYDEHVYAWRWEQFHRTGLMVEIMELNASVWPEIRSIDPRDLYAPSALRE